MADRKAAFLALIRANEGAGLDLTASDPGNWTGGQVGAGALRGSMCGISAAAFPSLDIASLTDDAIWFLYQTKYLAKIAYDDLPLPIALMVADCAVNQGVEAAARIMQVALDVEADGVVGPETVAAAQRYDNDPSFVVGEIAARRGLRYAETSGLPTFGLGWMRRLIHTYQAATTV